MTALTLQTLALLSVAYFAGCIVGCLLRRAVGQRGRQARPRDSMLPADGLVPAAAGVETAAAPATSAPLYPVVVRPGAATAPRDAFRRSDTTVPLIVPQSEAVSTPPSPPPPKAPAARSTAGNPAAAERAPSGESVSRFESALTGGRDGVSVAATATASDGGEDFKRIRSIDAATEQALKSLGVRHYAEIASWKQQDVARVSQALGVKGRIEQENWIEQAQMLARGEETLFSRQQGAAQPTAQPAAPVRPQPSPTPEPQPRARSTVAAAAATAAALAAAAGAASRRQPEPAETASQSPASATDAAPQTAQGDAAPPVIGLARDPLQRIDGINAEIERLLNVQGISRFAQIAHWAPADVERFDQLLGLRGRIDREGWIAQATTLARSARAADTPATDAAAQVPAESAPSRPARLADAIRDQQNKDDDDEPVRSSDLTGLRSVRSSAFRPGEPSMSGREVGARIPHPVAPEDLKRIRGIGVLIEKKLNQLGVVSYEQIANWSAEDIDRVSQYLDFKGRIERENWVEQARILASGGQTEFSRRADRIESDSDRG